ncbi:MAG TPA: hypothetical protein VE988_29985, partial [Gemmataceae bacterium]|nr:hypothetical protein [Gemmataceae bacterium]
RLNQLKRAGIASMVILAILAPFAVLLPLLLFAGLFLLGWLVFPTVEPVFVLLAWDGLVIAFFFGWATGLIAELQRSEVLSLEKFLHLPVSLKGVFLVNYLSSLASFNLLLFGPAMLGFALGLVLSKGLVMLLLLPLMAAFIFMVTALTYQFQGWLASLMVNKRRRRTIIVIVTMVFVLLAQLPNMVNFLIPREARMSAPPRMAQETDTEYSKRVEQWNRDRESSSNEMEMKVLGEIEHYSWYVNTALPIGWLPLGAWQAADGNVVPALLCTLGMVTLAGLSLRRSYATTVRLYTGHFTKGHTQTAAEQAAVKPRPAFQAGATTARFLEKRLPLISEHASAIAVSAFRSLTRAPEAKMMLLTPIILALVFGSMFIARGVDPPVGARPLMVLAGMGVVLLGMMQCLGNQFGFDRAGFRVFVLCSAKRADILLGKNVAFAPLALVPAALVTTVLSVAYPMRWDHFLGVWPQLLAIYLLFCLMANCLSIIAPMPIAAGSLKPAQPKLIPIMLQMLFFSLLPLAAAPAMALLGVEYLLQEYAGMQGVPIWLVFSLVECAAVFFLYRLVLGWQGNWLHTREQKILEIVTTKAE